MTPGRPDPAVVRRHLLAIDDALQTLRRHQGRSLAQLRSDRDHLWAVERGLQLCAQNALDIATHIAAGAGHDVADYATAIDRLASLGILPPEFAGRFRSIAGFRNVLVHGYLDLDLTVVHRLLQAGLDDFIAFARHINHHLESLAAPRPNPGDSHQ
jgi:uncharacterized protein YutE (UPF0331/DUF86 family)